MSRDDLPEHRCANLESIVWASPVLSPILHRWAAVALPDCWLVAGAIAQTVWNDAFGFALGYGLSDVDLVYFDPSELSEEAEAHHERRVRELLNDLPVRLDVKNEARVHLWYTARFGYVIAPYVSTVQAIGTFPTTATAIGVQPVQGALRIAAPFGLADLFALVVRPNRVQITRAIYETKVTRWRSFWPRLTIMEWDSGQ